MNILLITPDIFCRTKWQRFQKSLGMGLSPVLGLGYIAAAAEKAGHQVKILDLTVEPSTEISLNQLISDFKPELVGLYLTNITILKGVTVAQTIKKSFSKVPIAIGGPSIDLLPFETLNHHCFDFGLQGEADYTFVDLLNYLQGKQKEKPQGFVYRENNEIKIHGRPPYILNLDTLPFPARHLYQGHYMHIAAKKEPFASMMTSRGCPMRCGFCSKAPHWNRLRAMSAKKVVEEFKLLYQTGIKEVNVYDDTFTFLRQRTIDICKGIIAAKINILWACRTRVDVVDEELLDYLKKAGCYRLHIGVESGSNQILKLMDKRITKEQVLASSKLIKKFGFEIVGYFMLGYPGETIKTLEETREIIKTMPTDYIELNTFFPLPSSPVYQEILNKGIHTVEKEWKNYMELKRETLPTYYGEEIDKKQVDDYFYKIFREYYFNIKRIFHFIALINTPLRLKNYSRAFMRIVLLFFEKIFYYRKREKLNEPSLKI